MVKVINETGYKPSSIHKVVDIKVTVMLDAVPGAWHNVEDFLNHFTKHCYVQSAETMEADNA